MYAVVETSGGQHRVSQGQQFQVDRIDAEVGADVTLGRVLMVGGDEGVTLGAPTVEGASVIARVVSHDKADKVTTYKYRPRKRYRKTRGFRHSLTTLEVTAINGGTE